MPWVAAAAVVAGTAISAYGQIKSSQAQSNASDFDAAKAEQNATLSVAQAGEDERVFRVGLRKSLGTMRTQYAASGLQVAGTAADIIGESAANGELDALKLRHAGSVKAAGYQSDVSLDRMRADAYGTSGYLSASGSLLGGTGRAINSFGGGSSSYGSD